MPASVCEATPSSLNLLPARKTACQRVVVEWATLPRETPTRLTVLRQQRVLANAAGVPVVASLRLVQLVERGTTPGDQDAAVVELRRRLARAAGAH